MVQLQQVVKTHITRPSCGTPCAVTFCAEHKKRHPTPSVNGGVKPQEKS